jgi:putative ABC transport system permease protein
MRSPLRWLHDLVHRRRLERDAREELRFHMEALVEQKMAGGVPRSEAQRQARLELGDTEPVAEQLADARAGASLEAGGRDLLAALRALGRAPGFSLVCVLLIALGVGASTTLFTLVERVLLRPLPFPEPERLVRVFERSPERGVERTGAARGNLAAWRAQTRLFDGMAASFAMGRTLTDGDSEVVLAGQATCDFFPLLGVRALYGRTFTEDECRRATYNGAAAPNGPDPVVVLGHGLWTRRFGADPTVVGRTILLERRPFRIVGVLPRSLDVPEPGVEAYLPWDLANGPRDQRYTAALARLKPGVSLAAAEAELQAVAARLGREFPETNRGWSVALARLQEQATASARPVLLMLLGAAGLVLLIACGNVAILFFARGAARAHEAALRLALGASRVRILGRELIDAAVLAGLGGLLGTGLAVLAVASVPQLWPDLPRVHEIAVDAGPLAFALGATLLAALVAGGLPAWRVAHTDPRVAFGDGPRATASRPAQAARDLLVMAEIALTVVLLAGAGLLFRSVLALQATPPGFEAEGVLVAPVFLDSQGYDSGSKVRAYYARLFDRLRALPGVVAVGGATALPTSPLGPDFARPVWPEGRGDDARSVREARVRMITPEYLEALRIPVLAGRTFGDADAPGAPNVVAVNEHLARALWPGESAVGKSLVVDYSTSGTYPYEVVGVVGDVRFGGPRSEPQDEIFFPHAQRSYLVLNVAVRAPGAAPTLAADVQRVLHEIDPQKPAHGVLRLSDLLGATWVRERRAMQLLVAFAAVACLLSALGVYGMLTYRVRQRAPEIGVRLALGASGGRIAAWIAGESGRLVLRGALLGLLAAGLGARLIGGLLYAVAPLDVPTALGVVLVLAFVAAFATCLPAWRATRIDPAAVLRRG